MANDALAANLPSQSIWSLVMAFMAMFSIVTCKAGTTYQASTGPNSDLVLLTKYANRICAERLTG